MIKFKTLKCHNCASVMFNLPEALVDKLVGHTFVCDCCNKTNTISNLMFVKGYPISLKYMFEAI